MNEKYVSQMVVKHGDESLGTIRTKSPRKTHPRVLFQRMIVFIWKLFYTIQVLFGKMFLFKDVHSGKLT